jgi:hypothetical protein
MEFDISGIRRLSLYTDSLAVLQDRLFLLLLTEEINAEEFDPQTFTPAVDADGVTVPNQAHARSLGLQVERLRAQITALTEGE